jgi:hypothetical protein
MQRVRCPLTDCCRTWSLRSKEQEEDWANDGREKTRERKEKEEEEDGGLKGKSMR